MSQIAGVENSRSIGSPMTPLLQPIGFRLLDFARDQLASVNERLAFQGHHLHDGIHQARKSLRRTRAVLALAESAFDHQASVLDRDLQQLCHGLSPIRDAHALVMMLQRLQDTAKELQPILPDAIAAAKRRRDELLANLLERDPGLSRRRKRVADFAGRLASLDWQLVDNDVVRDGLARSERRAEKAEARAGHQKDDDEAWHRFRRRLRRLHQQNTLLGEIAPEFNVKRHPLEDRADDLGEAQDDVLLLARCRNHSLFAAEQRPQLRKIARQRLKHARN